MKTAIVVAACVVGLAAAWKRGTGFKLDPVPSIDVPSFMGRWYQAYDNLIEQATFENASLCDTADYALLPNGTITVLNRERQDSVDGPERALNGIATCPKDAPPACTVQLDGVPVAAPYYIVQLGPLEASQYQYAVRTFISACPKESLGARAPPVSAARSPQ